MWLLPYLFISCSMNLFSISKNAKTTLMFKNSTKHALDWWDSRRKLEIFCLEHLPYNEQYPRPLLSQ